jgi:Cof subfamily protein (haloacid dehalogenase superfamily)
MNFSKVKLIAVDMDGTLLNSKHEVSNRFFNIYNELKKKKIHFVVASGRQYQSIIDKLDIIKNEITIIAENGGVIRQLNKEPIFIDLSPENILESIQLLRKLDNTYIVLCGENSAYIETTDTRFSKILGQYFPKYEIVKDLAKVSGDKILKISAYHFECSETYILPSIIHLENKMQITVSGKHWLDISHVNANKGYAINIIQTKLEITKEETMAFGDYNNDLKMLELAHYSYAMENAHPYVKKVARFQTKSNNEEGVELILEQLLNVNTLLSK